MALTFDHIAIYILILIVSTEALPVPISETATLGTKLSLQEQCCAKGSLILNKPDEKPWKYFRVVQNTSTTCSSIVLNKRLDTDQEPSHCWPKDYEVTVILSGIQNVHPPTFCDSRCGDITSKSIAVSESAAVGLTVTTVTICDKDLFKNNEGKPVITLNNSVVDTRQRGDSHTIDIVLNQRLDYENVRLYHINIKVTDNKGKPSYNMLLTLNVMDEDDQGPIFTKKVYHCNVSEGTYTMANDSSCTVKATDQDKGLNAAVGYSVLDTGKGQVEFSIDANGKIQIKGKLDRESVASYVLPIKGYQLNRTEDRFDFAAVDLNIIDVNDNDPVFKHHSDTISIVENTPDDTLVYQFTATDADEGVNAEFTYQLDDGLDAFKVDSSTGKVTVKNSTKLDREKHPDPINITVHAVPTGKDKSSSPKARLTIKLLDVNDNSPKFNQTDYSVTVNKNHSLGILLTVYADDDDAGLNKKVKYTIKDQPSDNHFSVDPQYGKVSLTKNFSDNFMDIYHLIVQAEDQAKDPKDRRSTTVLVKVHVKDVNIHRPTITVLNVSRISENAEIGSTVALVKVSDKDVTDTLTVTFSDNHGNHTFSMNRVYPDSSVYEITVTSKLDREVVPDYSLTIFCSDGINHELKPVNIAVLDENDNAPTFKNNGNFSIKENKQAPSYVGTITATDRDAGQNANITYTIDPSSPWIANFTIDKSNGQISTKVSLDREALGEKKTLFIPVLAADHGIIPLTGTTKVTIEIQDENDNSPVFDQENVTISLDELSKQQIIHRAKASDADIGPNKIIRYSLNKQGNVEHFFNVSPYGELSTKKIISYEDSTSGKFSIKIIAKNPGSNLSATQNVLIKIKDVNNHLPHFNKTTYSFNINETTEPGAHIGRVVAFDGDSSAVNKEIQFHIRGAHSDTFRIGMYSGDIFLVKNIDDDAIGSIRKYTLMAYAENEVHLYNGAPSNTSTKIVIDVTPVNEYAPQFTEDEYTCSVRENYNGTLNCTVLATDHDYGHDGDITYSVVNSTIISIDQKGQLTLLTNQDYETIKKISVKVLATDGGRSSKKTFSLVTIQIINVNDCPPELHISPHMTVSESIPYARGNRFLHFSTKDMDGDLNKLTYKISPASTPFMARSGFIILKPGLIKNPFDYETQSNYTFMVHVSDTEHETTETVTVKVLPVNEFPPVFIKNYSYVLPENSPHSYTIQATDKDDGNDDGTVHYSLDIPHENIIPGNITLSRNGSLAISNLDREKAEHFTFTVLAIDGGKPPLTGVTVVQVIVQGVDEFPPYYLDGDKNISLTVNEATEYAHIFTSEALDKDVGIGSEIKYRLVKGPVSSFKVSSQGQLSIHPLSIDNGREVDIQIEAYNPGKTAHKATQNIKIHVQDINNKVPHFSKNQYKKIVSECEPVGYKILRVTAEDKDIDLKYKAVTYWIMDNNTFNIDKVTGDIHLTRQLDFDPPTHDRTFNFKVYATDLTTMSISSNHTTSTNVTVTVQNCNDNGPMITPVLQRCSLPEETTGSFSCNITATDIDNLQSLKYSIVGDNQQKFTISTATGVIRAPNLDYDLANVPKLFVLNVSATDGQFSSFATVLIELKNTNDNKPEFQKPEYNFTIPENVHIAYLGDVIATDADGDNITYSMTGSCSGLEIEGGRLLQKKPFDYETTQVCKMNVQAKDSSNASTVPVTVNILDANDNVPQFRNASYDVNVNETTKVKTTLVQIDAHDADITTPNNKVTYSIISGNIDDTFKLNTNTGALFISKHLNASILRVYTIVIEARDGGSPSLSNSTVVTINVDDVNTNPPWFLDTPYTAQVTENTQNHTLVKLFAQDSDPGTNLLFALKGHNKNFYLVKDTLHAQKLDADILSNLIVPLVVTVSDGQYNSTTTVQVTILDVNDNAPKFHQINYQKNVRETAPVNTSLLKIDADDADITAPNKKVTYNIISGNIDDAFKLNHTTGDLSINKQLNASILQVYTIVIEARDGGSPSLSNSKVVTINVDDVNDNPPWFLYTPYTAQVTENTQDHPLVKLFAQDSDPDANLTFTLTGYHQYFYIAGDMLHVKTFDVEQLLKNTISLEITVSDGKFNTTTSVQVTILDVNDNYPYFTNGPFSVILNDTSSVGTSVIDIDAIDSDFSNSMIMYFLYNGMGYFDINRDSGEITLQKVLDVNLKSFNLSVVVFDGGSPLHSNETNVIVNVHVTNKCTPKFVHFKDKVVKNINENAGNQFINLSATDQDPGHAGQVSYSITSYSEKWPDIFEFNNITGILKMIGNVDYETTTTHEYSFEVKAKDHAIFSKSATAIVIIRIVDVDEPPMLSLPTATIYKELNATAGSVISTVSVKDKDTAEKFRNFTFSITSTPSSQFFQINEKGVITVKRALSVPNVYNLNITVTDGGGLSDSKVLNVTVSNITGLFINSTILENQNPPVAIEYLPYVTKNMGNIIFTLDKKESSRNFAILQNGTLVSNKTFDREKTPQFFLDIKGHKNVSGDMILKAQIQMQVTVLDVNDNAPVFNRSMYRLNVNESTTVNTQIGLVTATDIDENPILIYSIDPRSDIFGINPTTGAIYLQTSLDYESTHKTYKLMVICNDTLNAGNSSVEIDILDANDNFPAFQKKTYTYNVSESQGKGPLHGAVVKATDPDTADQGHLLYTVADPISGGLFSVDDMTGQLSLKQALDFDTMKSSQNIQIKVEVKDTANHVNTTTVIFHILDANDNAPNFTKPEYIFHVLEGVTVLGNNFSVKAMDKDSGENAKITFSLDGKDNHQFNISTDKNMGYLHVLEPLDRESVLAKHTNGSAVYTLTVVAKDSGDPQQTSTALVHIYVDDVNDCPPQFNNPNYTASVQEGTAVGTKITTVTTTDCDYLPQYKNVTYSLQGPNHDVFNVTSSGDIVLNKPVSLQKKRTYILSITASDGVNKRSALLTISVLDANDHSPNFTKNIYTFNVSENIASAVIGEVQAVDEDPGENGNVSYAITSGNSKGFFNITKEQNNSALIRLVSALDREKNLEYSLIITASDNAKTGKRQGTCTVMVEVTDLNDNNPVFETKAGYFGSISEEVLPGTQIKINPPIHASDQDSGNYGTKGLVYSLKPSKPFCINSSTAVVKVCEHLDRETQSSYKLQVLAKDTLGKQDGRTANTSLTITVTDYNDEVPEFVKSTYRYTVPENTASGTPVGNVTVTDADENGIQDVQVTIQHGSKDNFYISYAVYDSRLVATVYVSGVLDREKKSFYNMTVQATDSAHSSETSVIVTVSDVNDNAPVFNKSQIEIKVEENSPASVLYTVTAYDKDQPNSPNSEITFSFSDETRKAYGDKFELFENGSLFIRKELDREKISSYFLTVLATDKGQPPMNASTSITVTVLDINDHAPSFCDSPPCVQHSYVVETAPVGSILALPVATDPDKGNNGTIEYTILQSPASKYFTINNSTGLVAIGRSIVINTLLAENIVNKTDNTTSVMLEVVIEARDKGPGQGKKSTLTLQVTVEQINDNAPVFEHPCSFNITEELPSGTVVGVCSAIIPNATHSHMTYRLITGFDSSSFSIDQTNGTIRTATRLDREEASHYSLSVQVTDGRTPERTAFTAVTITVQDINDNIPVFYQSPISFQIPENNNWSRSINTSAVDRDEGQNGMLTFAIDEDFGGLFAVDNASGIVTVREVFDFEKRSNYTFHVLATDHGKNPKSSSVLVNITVIDVNDNTPTFSNVKHQYDIPENATGKVFTLSAMDADSGYNGKVQYSIKHSDQGPFIIYPLDGAVYIDGHLDYETKSVYHLTFEATDEGIPPLSSEINITIQVLDVYDFVLKFPRDVYETIVNASAKPGTQILSLAIQGAHTTYEIAGQDSGYFAVNGTGAVTVKAPLGVHNRQDVITVVATNNKGQKAKCKVIIYITGHEVFFPKNEFNVSLPENLNQSSLLLDLNTTEEMTGQHVLYTITGIDPYVADVFRITPTTGRVYCDKALDRETEGEYSIYISAYLSTSTGRHKRQVDESSTTIKLTVHVDDEDDNPPTFTSSQQALFGVPGDAKANFLVTQLQAYDPDLGENGRIVYTATGDTGVFGVDKETGEVTTLVAIASKPDTKTFKLTVTALDIHGSQGHTLHVKIIVVPPTDRLMLQVNTSLTEFRRKQDYLIGNMSHLLGVEVQLEMVESHHEQTSSGTKLDISKTDMYFHGINQTTGTVVPSDVMMGLITKANSELKKLFGNDKVVEVREVKVMPLTDPSAITVPVIALISVAIFIFFGSVIAIILAQYSWTRLNDERKALEKQQQANLEMNDFEMGTLKSHTSHEGSQRATAAINPVFLETDLDEGVKKKEKKIKYETQELKMNFSDEPFRFSDEIIFNNNNDNNGARSVADSALENTSLNSNDQHKSDSSGRSPEPGTSHDEDPKVQSLKVDDGPVMTSSPRTSRDVGPETHKALLRQTSMAGGTNIQIMVGNQAAELLEKSDDDIEEFPMRNRVLTLTMESGETETDDGELIDDSNAKSVETAGNQPAMSQDMTEGSSVSPVKPKTDEDQAKNSSISKESDTQVETTAQAEPFGITNETSSNDGKVEKLDEDEIQDEDEVTSF